MKKNLELLMWMTLISLMFIAAYTAGIIKFLMVLSFLNFEHFHFWDKILTVLPYSSATGILTTMWVYINMVKSAKGKNNE